MRSLARNTCLALALTLPAPLFAQSVTVQSVVDTKLYGTFGTLANIGMRLGGGGSLHDIATTTYLSGHKLRTDSQDGGMIVDLDASRITRIDHKNKTYSSMTFAEMAEQMRQAQEHAKQQMEQEKAKAEAKDPRAAKGDFTVKPKVSYDRTGQHETVAGFDTEKAYLTVELQGEAKPEGEQAQEAGSMVFLMEMALAKDAPQAAAMREFQKAYAAKMGTEFKSQMQALQQLYLSDPRIKTGFEAAAKEMANQKGYALRTVTYVSLVPPGQPFDRQLALGDASAGNEAKADDQPKKGGLRGFMGKMKQAAEAAANKQNDQKAPPKQTTLMAMRDEVKSVQTGAVPADVFSPPAGYKEVKPQMLR